MKLKNKWFVFNLLFLSIFPCMISGLILGLNQEHKVQQNVNNETQVLNNSLIKSVPNNIFIDISKYDNKLSNFYSDYFYNNNEFANVLLPVIQNNFNNIINLCNPTSTLQYNDATISINNSNDQEIYNFANQSINGKEYKKINGQLAINITQNTPTLPNQPEQYGIILCGFKRDQACIFTNNNDKNSNTLINAILKHEEIKLENPNIENIKMYLVQNIYYYKNYNNPIKSIFTNIASNMISYDKVHNLFKINIPSNSMLYLPTNTNNSQGAASFTLRFNYNQNQDNSLPVLIIVLSTIIGVIVLAIIICLLILAYGKHNKIKTLDLRLRKY